MRKAQDVIEYLEKLSRDTKHNMEIATLQREQLFYQSRYIFLREIVIELKEKIGKD